MKKQERKRNDPEVRRLAAEAACDERTVLRVMAGQRVYGDVAERITSAAKKLRIKLNKG